MLKKEKREESDFCFFSLNFKLYLFNIWIIYKIRVLIVILQLLGEASKKPQGRFLILFLDNKLASWKASNFLGWKEYFWNFNRLSDIKTTPGKVSEVIPILTIY